MKRLYKLAAMTLSVLFDISNVFVLPFWTLMILLPNWGVTRKVMGSLLPFVALAVLYIYLFINSLDPESAAAFANPQLSDLARLFSDDRVMATGWVHFLVMDLFVGRWIYWEGQRTGVWTVHSLVLCLFAGPMGLLSHIVTQWVSQALGRSRSVSNGESSSEAVAAQNSVKDSVTVE